MTTLSPSLRMRFAAVFLCLALHSGAAARPASLMFGQMPSEFAERRAAVRKAMGSAILLLRAPIEEGDLVRYRTDNDLMYLTGVEAPGAWLALLPDGDPSNLREILFLPPQNRYAALWQDPVPGPGPETERDTGIQSVQSAGGMWNTLTPSIHQAKTVYLLGQVGDWATHTLNGATEERLRRINPDLSVEGRAGPLISVLRWRKTESEIGNMVAAIHATGEAEFNAARAIRPGAIELGVEGAILKAFREGGAVREGFPCIVGSGPNSCTLHHVSGTRVMKSGDMVVCDIGAEYNYYSADITRTFPCGGHFTPRQRAIYQLVLDVQTGCRKFGVPGKTTLRDMHMHAVSLFRASPLRAKDDSGQERTMDAFFLHALGHWLGMDVHDVSGSSSVLQPGCVFTIEPGLYIRSEGIGVRIEDDYLVTEKGIRKLSQDIPSSVKDIEAMMRGRRVKPRPRMGSAGRTMHRG